MSYTHCDTKTIDVLAKNVSEIDLAVDGHTNHVVYGQQTPQREKEYAYDRKLNSGDYGQLIDSQNALWRFHWASSFCNFKQMKQKSFD